MKRLLAVLLIMLTLSCSTTRKYRSNLIQVPVMEKIQVNNRLVPVYIPPDSTTIRALFECDSMNNVRLKELTELKSSGTTSDFSFQNNILHYRADFKKDSVKVIVRDSIVEREVPVEVRVPVEVNIITGFQWFQIWLGRVFSALVIILLGIKAVKSYFKVL